jgi:glutamyl-tRNA synthetase
MLALLGWNPGTEQEIFSMQELINAFSIEKVHKSGSRFDPEKARWFNHQYLQGKNNNYLALEFREYLRSKGYHIDIKNLEELVGMVKERVSFVKDIWEQTDFFFSAPVTYDQEIVRKRWKKNTPAQMAGLSDLLGSLTDFSPVTTEQAVKSWIERNGYNTGDVMNAFRLVVVGSMRGPKISDIIKWIGKEETLRRIDRGISVIGK